MDTRLLLLLLCRGAVLLREVAASMLLMLKARLLQVGCWCCLQAVMTDACLPAAATAVTTAAALGTGVQCDALCSIQQLLLLLLCLSQC